MIRNVSRRLWAPFLIVDGTVYIVGRYLRDQGVHVRDDHRFSGDSLDMLIRDWAAWMQKHARPLPPDFLERCRSEIDAGAGQPGGFDVMAAIRKQWPQLEDAVEGKIVEYGRLESFKDKDDPAA